MKEVGQYSVTIMSSKLLEGKVGVVVGVANKRSIAFAIAKAWHEAGAKLIFNYQGERLKDGVLKLIHENFGEDVPVYDLDVSSDESVNAFFERVRQHTDKVDCLLHSVAFAPKEALGGSFLERAARRSRFPWISPLIPW